MKGIYFDLKSWIWKRLRDLPWTKRPFKATFFYWFSSCCLKISCVSRRCENYYCKIDSISNDDWSRHIRHGPIWLHIIRKELRGGCPRVDFTAVKLDFTPNRVSPRARNWSGARITLEQPWRDRMWFTERVASQLTEITSLSNPDFHRLPTVLACYPILDTTGCYCHRFYCSKESRIFSNVGNYSVSDEVTLSYDRRVVTNTVRKGTVFAVWNENFPERTYRNDSFETPASWYSVYLLFLPDRHCQW